MLSSKHLIRLYQYAKYSSVQKVKFRDCNAVVDPVHVLTDPHLSYQDVFYLLHNQARRSMLLHLNTDPSVDHNYLKDQLQNFCSSFGKVVYCDYVKQSKNYFLVEFLSLESIQNLSSYSNEGMLTLRMAELSPSGLDLSLKQPSASVAKHASTSNLIDQVRNASSISEQVSLIYNAKRASSDVVRQKLFLPSLFQDFFNWHMKTNITAISFGTSFSTFSTESADVDISLTHLSDASSQPNASISSLNHLPAKTAQMYKSLQRVGTNAMFTEASKHIEKYFPGVTNLSSFDALFPLISFYFTPLQIPVDISFNNKPGVQSTWLLNVYTRNDERVAPFLFFLREWGKQAKITSHGGALYDGLTPYMLTCLGLFYLMRCQPYVLPSMMDMLTKVPSKTDLVIGGFRTKFITDMELVKTSNTDSIEKLIVGFFN